MGIEGSRPLQRKASRTKSNLSDKLLASSDQIVDFASQINSLTSLQSTASSRLDYDVFQKLPFTGKFVPLPFCSFISSNNNSVFLCYDCSTDDHAYLCQTCFEKGSHQGHRFSVFPNNAGRTLLYCRCGDWQFTKKGIICQTHKEVKKLVNPSVDAKQRKAFALYFTEILKTLYSLIQNSRQHVLMATLFNYLQKITTNNQHYAKLVCQFLLDKNSINEFDQVSNLSLLIQSTQLSNMSFFRNLAFSSQYKLPILREMIQALNKNPQNIQALTETIINFSGKIQLLEILAKQQDLIPGIQNQAKIKTGDYNHFYNILINQEYKTTEIWRSIVRNKLIKPFIGNTILLMTIIQHLNRQKDIQSIISLLEQLLSCSVVQSNKYVIPCLMAIAPECFLTDKSTKQKGFDKKIESFFAIYYAKIFSTFSTHRAYDECFTQIFLLLPFFNFGQATINKFWAQLERRVNILQKSKEKAVIKQASMNYFRFLTNLLYQFMSWQHTIINQATQFKFRQYISDKKLIERLLRQSFDKNRKILRLDLLEIIDSYTQKERSLAADSIKKYLRYNAKKQKYYYIGERLQNNLYNYQDLKAGSPIKLSDWQEFVGKKVFTQTIYKIVPNLIKIAQRGLMEDIQMVKTVSNISIALTVLNKSQKKTLKQVTRTFIKEIPDVNEDVYYVLADIRDRLELDMDDLEESGSKGKKKQKLDLISEIRDKKYRQMKEKQDKILKQWIKKGDQKQYDPQNDIIEQNICHICKEKDSPKTRFVFPCNFTRNNVISTLLKSEVTDLDISICLHKVHEQCYEKIKQKKQCPVCKFKANCYIPEKPLADQSYTKNWLRNFENIVTTINLQSGKSFNSDWATIFMTYLVFSRSFKVLLKSTQIQVKQQQKVDQLIMLHYRSQLQKWPDLTKQAIKRAQKTVKGQVRRQSNIKKVVKSFSLDMVIQQIIQQPLKNQNRISKKVRELVNTIGHVNSSKVTSCFENFNSSASLKQVLQNSLQESEQDKQLFKIRQFSKTAKEYLQVTSIKCPMCGKYQPETWECLFCQKISCSNCMNIRFHCQRDHRGSSIILFLNNAQYALWYQNRQIQRDSLYRNQYSQGWKRNLKPQGWKLSTDQIYNFFDTVLHSLDPNKKSNSRDDDSEDDNQRRGNNRFGTNTFRTNNNNNMFGGNNNNNVFGEGNFWNPPVFSNTANMLGGNGMGVNLLGAPVNYINENQNPDYDNQDAEQDEQ